MANWSGDMVEMNRFSIRDIENLTGIKAHTLRIWEQRYSILQPKRTPTNIRYYDAEDLRLALRIALLNSYGYKISNIHKMSNEDMNSLIEKISDRDFKLNALVNNMLEAMLHFKIDLFEQYLNDYIAKQGIEQTIEKLVFLFLEKIGLMWMTSRIFPAQEHLVSNVIVRKLSLAIESLPSKKTDASPTILLYLPEGEIHDMGLLYVYYLLRKWGKNPVYLCANSPLKDVGYVVDVLQIPYIYTHLTSTAQDFDVAKYVRKLDGLFPNTQHIYVSGAMLQNVNLQGLERISPLYTLTAVKEALQVLGNS